MQNVEVPNSQRALKIAARAELLNKQTALEATEENQHEATKDLDELTQDSSALERRPFHHPIEQIRTIPHPAPTKATELEIGVP